MIDWMLNNPNIVIPSLLGLHILGIFLCYVSYIRVINKGLTQKWVDTEELLVAGGVCAFMGGMFTLLFFWITVYKENKRYE